MPHFVIDCSENIIKIKSPKEIIQKVYDTAESTDLFDKGDIKVRISPFEYYNIGNSTDDFIHIFANIMEGRTITQKKNLSDRIIAELKLKFPKIQGPKHDDICYATQNRQDAVRELAKDAEMLIVVGSTNSSNSNRLKELSEQLGVPSYLVDQPQQIQQNWFDDINVVGVTAGASAPEILVKQVIDQIKHWGGEVVNEVDGPTESISFSLPIELRVK